VENIDHQVCDLAGGTDKETSVGGMSTKLQAACITCDAGIPCIIANGKTRDIVLKVVGEGKFVGTTFLPSPKKLVAKKRWLAFGSRPKGKVIVDEGARAALLKGKSLLAVGVVGVEGKFQVGDVVAVVFKDVEVFRGITRCSSEDLNNVKGTRFKHEIIHCDNLAMVKRI
jgi:glutamate 5-kinase